MPGKIDLYNLGSEGVVLTPTKIHRKPGTFERTQNTVPSLNQAEGGVQKRLGLAKLTGSTLTGSVLGFTNVPLPNTADTAAFAQTLYAAIDDSVVGSNTNTWRTSTDGTTWANATSPARAQEQDKVDTAGASTPPTKWYGGRIATYNRAIYYPVDGYTQYPTASHAGPPIRVFDGTTDRVVLTAAYDINAGATTNPDLITDMLSANGYLFVASHTLVTATHYVNVHQYSASENSYYMVGRSGLPTDGGIFAMVWFQGRLWVGVTPAGGAEGEVYSIRPREAPFEGDTTWTEEFGNTEGSVGGVTGLVEYKGLLYILQDNDEDTANLKPTVWVRSSLGAYTASDEGTAGQYGQYGSPFVYEDELYVTLYEAKGTPEFTVRKFDGSSWSQVYDIRGNQAGTLNSGQAVLFGGNMYLVIPDSAAATAVILKNASGTWSEVDTGTALRGYLAVLKVVV